MKSLLKRAKGYSYSEVQDEYSVGEDGNPVLVKRKVLEKYCPPDSTALKTYLELNPDPSLSQMSDEELEQEKQRLLDELSLQEQKDSEGAPKESQDASQDECDDKNPQKIDKARRVSPRAIAAMTSGKPYKVSDISRNDKRAFRAYYISDRDVVARSDKGDVSTGST